MNKTTAEYLRKLGYSVQENIYQDNQTRSIKELDQSLKEQQVRKKILAAKFQEISDIELIEELQKRVENQAIKLSIYPHQEHIFIVAKDATKEVSFPLPIEIKGGQHE
jgi:3-dehydroquinate dehydratase